jgi:hypothetical protein
MAALSLSDPRMALFAERLRGYGLGCGYGDDHRGGRARPARHASTDRRSRVRHDLGPVVRATLIMAVFLLVFGPLLRDADPIFASLVVLPRWDLDVMVSHL